MITKMDKYTLVSPGACSEELILALQELSVVDITRSHKPVDDHSSRLLAESALIQDKMAGTALKKRAEALDRDLGILKREAEFSALWGNYDKAELEALGEAGFPLHFHSLKKKKFNGEWTEEYPLAVIAEKDGDVLFVVVGDNAGIPGEITAPRPLDGIRAEIAGIAQERDAVAGELKALPSLAEGLKKEYDAIVGELDAYLAQKASVLGKGEPDNEASGNDLNSFIDIFEAYAPAADRQKICTRLDGMEVYYTVEEASEDSTPIKLHNNWFARQFEVFTGMYGLPSYGEFDPTPILAPFYLLFFGMCLGDAGYGILLMLIALLLKAKSPDSGLGRMHSLIFLLGAGTFVIGAFLGTFFGISLFDAAWVPEAFKRCLLVKGNVGTIAGFDPQIVCALGIGVFHICLAMVVKTACFSKHYGLAKSLSTWGWTLLVVGGVITAALAIGGLLGGNALKWTIIIIGALSALGIFVFNTPGRNPLLNIGAGLWDTYSSVTGLLSDVLSYVRLYALGLAGGMLGGVFNSLALMMLGDNPTWHWLPFLLLLLIGHGLNLALSCLGAFVHPMRLTFVEYFKNSGYEGTGRKYQPLTNTNKQ
ncbi:MAG: hypothetical protein MJY49_03005 [Bacteroidales bacterium]|nr:hypothetical protein [Bacteroidales bacterium]